MHLTLQRLLRGRGRYPNSAPSPATWGAVLRRGHQRARVPSRSSNRDGVFSGAAKDAA